MRLGKILVVLFVLAFLSPFSFPRVAGEQEVGISQHVIIPPHLGEADSYIVANCTIFSSVEQKITVKYTLFEVIGAELKEFQSFEKTYVTPEKRSFVDLTIYYYVSIQGKKTFRSKAEIIKYELDTYLENNVAWSQDVELKERLNVMAELWCEYPEGKLPSQEIKLVSRVTVTRASEPRLMLTLRYTDTKEGKSVYETLLDTKILFLDEGYRFHNFTIKLPWCDFVNFTLYTEEPEDRWYPDNYVIVLFALDPEIILEKLNLPEFAASGSKITITFEVLANRRGKGIITIRKAEAIGVLKTKSVEFESGYNYPELDIVVPETDFATSVTYVGEVFGLDTNMDNNRATGKVCVFNETVLGGYTEEEIETICNNPEQYIFDVKLETVRKVTKEEREAIKAEYVSVLRSIEPLPRDRFRATIELWDQLASIDTNSTINDVRFYREKGQLFILISGKSGTRGMLELIIPAVLVPSPANIGVYLDGEPIDFSLAKVENYYHIGVEYTHSIRTLMVSLAIPPTPPIYTQPLIILGGIIVAIALLLFQKRRTARLRTSALMIQNTRRIIQY